MTKIARTTALLLGAYNLLALTAPAVAAPPRDQTISQKVDLADLDLSTRAGMQRLRFRVAAAAYAVCGDELQEMALDDFMIIQKCVHDVRKSSETKIAALVAKRIQTASR